MKLRFFESLLPGSPETVSNSYVLALGCHKGQSGLPRSLIVGKRVLDVHEVTAVTDLFVFLEGCEVLPALLLLLPGVPTITQQFLVRRLGAQPRLRKLLIAVYNDEVPVAGCPPLPDCKARIYPAVSLPAHLSNPELARLAWSGDWYS